MASGQQSNDHIDGTDPLAVECVATRKDLGKPANIPHQTSLKRC